jgi:DNA-binding HxlR family transcriptional regulator
MTIQLPDPNHQDCRAISSVLALVGDKWTVLIVVLLGDGPKRFNEIKRMVGGISQRMLTFTLRGLERDGLVTRTVYPTTPQRVDYELTKLGGTLWQAVEPLSLWAREHVVEILDSRERFDRKKKVGAQPLAGPRASRPAQIMSGPGGPRSGKT